MGQTSPPLFGVPFSDQSLFSGTGFGPSTPGFSEWANNQTEFFFQISAAGQSGMANNNYSLTIDSTVVIDGDGDGVGDSSDAFPADPNESVDTDGDGTGDNADTDDDGDGISDAIEIAIGFDPIKTDSNDNGTADGDDLVALLQNCANAVVPALTPPGSGVLVGLLLGFGAARLHARRGRRTPRP